jgi:hypothetical protein
MIEEKLISETKAAASLDLTVKGLQKLREPLGIPHVKIGTRIMYSPKALDGWIAERTIGLTLEDILSMRHGVSYSVDTPQAPDGNHGGPIGDDQQPLKLVRGRKRPPCKSPDEAQS